MSRITPVSAKKRKLEEAIRGKTAKPQKKIKKQKHYHSSSEDEASDDDHVGFAPVSLADSDNETPLPARPKAKKEKSVKRTSTDLKSTKDNKKRKQQDIDSAAESAVDASSSSGEDDDSNNNHSDSSEGESDTQSTIRASKKKSKRNDPEAFSTSIARILSTKLPTFSRADPVLSRSAEASKARQAATDEKLELKARQRLRAEKQAALQRGRNTDVLGIERGITGEVAEQEKALRKIATRGVVQLFNAFRAAHDRADEARREERKKGTVGMGERERAVNEVSKEGFLELIGGKKKAAPADAAVS